jgi:hypothetical protein
MSAASLHRIVMSHLELKMSEAISVVELFDETVDEGDHEWAHVCRPCAERHKLVVSDSCCGGNVCLIKGCYNETSLVTYLRDER